MFVDWRGSTAFVRTMMVVPSSSLPSKKLFFVIALADK